MKSRHYDSDSEEARKNGKCKTENKRKRVSGAQKRPLKHTYSVEEASTTIGKDFEGPRISVAEVSELVKCYLILMFVPRASPVWETQVV